MILMVNNKSPFAGSIILDCDVIESRRDVQDEWCFFIGVQKRRKSCQQKVCFVYAVWRSFYPYIIFEKNATMFMFLLNNFIVFMNLIPQILWEESR
jgi:hypothetical protein